MKLFEYPEQKIILVAAGFVAVLPFLLALLNYLFEWL